MKNFYVFVILALIFIPLQVSDAQTSITADSLIKGSEQTVYYYAADGNRYVFPNDKTFGSWFSNFSSVITVSNDELAKIPLVGNITYRPGVRMVKIETNSKVYAVEEGGILRWVKNEKLAKQLYGNDWNKKIDDIPDVFFMNYKEDKPIEDNKDYIPETVVSFVQTINKDRGITETVSAPRATTGVGSLTIPATPATPYPGQGIPASPATPAQPNYATSTPSNSATSTPATPAQPNYATSTPSNSATSTPSGTTPATPATSATPTIPATPATSATPGMSATSTDITPPIISNLQTTDITANSATIHWSTDEASDSLVEYGLTASYGFTASNNATVTYHQINLTNLASSTIYHYKVSSTDGNNKAQSEDHIFTTLVDTSFPSLLAPVMDFFEWGSNINPCRYNLAARFQYQRTSNSQTFNVYLQYPNQLSFTKYAYQIPATASPIRSVSGLDDSYIYSQEIGSDGQTYWGWGSKSADNFTTGNYRLYITVVGVDGNEGPASSVLTNTLNVAPTIINPGASVSQLPFEISLSNTISGLYYNYFIIGEGGTLRYESRYTSQTNVSVPSNTNLIAGVTYQIVVEAYDNPYGALSATKQKCALSSFNFISQ